MARNRHKKSHFQLSSPAPQRPAGKPSRAAQMMAERIASGGAKYMEESFIRIMQDSIKLADEPEFIDMTIDGQLAISVTERWLKKYEARLEAAEKKGKNELHLVSDDMRINIMDELATPAFRNEVEKRLRAMVDRLTTTEDIKKLEMALYLEVILKQKEIPWGICGLVMGIYNRTMDQKLQAIQDEEEVMNAVEAALKEEGEDITDLKQSLKKQPGKIQQIGEKIAQKVFGAKPGLRERLEKQAWESRL